MDIHSTFAGASAVKIGGKGDDRSGGLDARIDGGDEFGMAASTGSAGDGDAGGVGIGTGKEMIEDSDAAECLYRHGQAAPMIFEFELQQRFTPGEEIVTEGHGTHARQGGASDLAVGAVSLFFPMPIGVQDDGNPSLIFTWTVQGSVDPEAGQYFDG